MDAGEATKKMVDAVRARPWGLAVATIADGETAVALDDGDEPLTESSLFQIGSITKTITGVLLAESVVRGELTLETTLGHVFAADAGRCAAITVLDLATQRSGLPRLPPNLESGSFDPRDPYGAFTEPDLFEALAAVDPPTPGEHLYSNFGFMVLGLVLARTAGAPYGELARTRVLEPLGMGTAGCPAPEAGRVRGYNGVEETPWWHNALLGAGGVGASVRDMAAYLAAHLRPEDTPLATAIDLATRIHVGPPSAMGLGWGHQGGGWWHNGGTGGFSSFCAFHRPTQTAVVLLVNSADQRNIDSVGFRVLTELVRR